MPKTVTVESHLSSEELYSRYRASTSSVQRSHYQIIWLLADGKTPATEARSYWL
ncbi:MAG: hypothetical protein F6K50_46285 [Moorea sp. SIO3I7]|uniref:hypothetical protein n=1 Tax=unclassified Moorena TaxID=2683338 RepID=UPI0013C24D7C|nr:MULTISPECIES: hypothetical protein [unclassified Moorena]NEO02500.1 hypothetical protein [Moorena sp. SIO3I7]NEO10222.1 hypothetical protein [Moorena sp. SIO3I8]NEP26354.1 hypothetical protein [Moorena sp. SIO3I6]NEQ62133.1 hypothetical protein [Moorena sp. SIO4A1]